MDRDENATVADGCVTTGMERLKALDWRQSVVETAREARLR